MTIRWLHALLLLVACPPLAVAEMVERTDPNGVVYFSPDGPPREVIMYSDAGCSYCRQARRYFRNNGIRYVEYDIHASPGRLQEFRRLGGRVTPLIIIGERTIHGFNARAIEAALDAG